MDAPDGSESPQTTAIIEAKEGDMDTTPSGGASGGGVGESVSAPSPSSAFTTTPETIAPSIEALLLSVDKAIPSARIAEALGLIQDAEDPAQAALAEAPTPTDTEAEPKSKKSKKGKGAGTVTPGSLVQSAIDLLNAHYEQSARAFRIQKIAGGYRVMTLPKFAPVLESYHGRRERHGISRAALETLAIIAYKQPMTRASLEAIRGVSCGEVLRSLIERRLITIVGRAEELGRPMLYGTTKAFLETFGLSSVKDLPSPDELRARVGDADPD